MAAICEKGSRWIHPSAAAAKNSMAYHDVPDSDDGGGDGDDDDDDDKPLVAVKCKANAKMVAAARKLLKRSFEDENLPVEKQEGGNEALNASKDGGICYDSDDDRPLVRRMNKKRSVVPGLREESSQIEDKLVLVERVRAGSENPKVEGVVSVKSESGLQSGLQNGEGAKGQAHFEKEAKVNVNSVEENKDRKQICESNAGRGGFVKSERVKLPQEELNPNDDSDDDLLVAYRRVPRNGEINSMDKKFNRIPPQDCLAKPESLSSSNNTKCLKTEHDAETLENENKPLNMLFKTSEKKRIIEDDDSDDDKPLSVGCKSYIKVESQQNVTSIPSNIGLLLFGKEPVVNIVKARKDLDDSDDDKPLATSVKVSKFPKDDRKILKPLHSANITKTQGKTSVPSEMGSKRRFSKVISSVKVSKFQKLGDGLSKSLDTSDGYSSIEDYEDEDEDDEDYNEDYDRVPIRYHSFSKKSARKSRKRSTEENSSESESTQRRVRSKRLKKRQDEIQEEQISGGSAKWTTLEHNGVIFPPPYTPHGVKMLYDGQPVDLTSEQEEVATMFAVMKDTDYAVKPKFITNFWEDWSKILGPEHVIKKLELCDFTPIYEWHNAEKEKKKQMSSEEKKKLKEEKLKLEEKYMWALVDGVKEKVGNFRVEPPGLFRGRGEHPKMGRLKRRMYPEDIVINIGKDAPVPECPLPGHRWNEIRHDNTVTWLAFWNDPINTKECKYVFLAPSSNLKGQSDKEKYEKARQLKDYIDDIRTTYTRNFESPDHTERQIAVATYLIDRLALRAGNEKDDDEADTVGCCSLKVEHVALIPPKSLEFDFLGKDSIRYFNTVDVDERVFRAIEDFKRSKQKGDDLFDKLDTNKLNAHLKEIMPGLTAKVFRTYNASITLDTLLKGTREGSVIQKIADYQTANKEVAILCNHQRSVSKSHGAQMERLEGKMAELEALLEELKRDLKCAKGGKSPTQKNPDMKVKRSHVPELLERKILQTNQKLEKMKLEMKIKDDLKTVALGTSKINYLDPRITVAWCKCHEVPIEKIFNKSLLAKFLWAMDVEPDFHF